MKKFVAAMVVLAGLSTAALAQQDYPNRIIKILQGFPRGGNVDISPASSAMKWRKASANRSWSRPSPVLPARSRPRLSREAMPTVTR